MWSKLGPQVKPTRQLHQARLKRYFGSKTRVNIAELLQHSKNNNDDQQIILNGFVRSVRKQKRVAFAAIGDGSTADTVQAVLKPEDAQDLSTGAALTISGKWVRSLSNKLQSHELQVNEVKVLGDNDVSTYPIQKKYHTPEYLRSLPHLRARIPHNSLLLQLRSHVIATITTFFTEQGFVQTHTPIITSSDCEGAGEVFTVASESSTHNANSIPTSKHTETLFFRTPKYLTVSAQLHLEALAQAVGKVWTLSPTFRAEKSDTARHLSEFYMLEAEISFVDDLNSVMDLVEGMMKSVATSLASSQLGLALLSRQSSVYAQMEEHGHALPVSSPELKSRWDGLIRSNWPRITYDEAVAKLRAASSTVKFEHPINADDGLQAEHERYLAEVVGQGSPIFVTDYPKAQKPFYMLPSTNRTREQKDNSTVACFDLLVPQLCELVGGSLREHRLEPLLESMEAKGLSVPPLASDTAHSTLDDAHISDEPDHSGLNWYVDLRRYGSVPHGGFGLGFDRLLCYLAGVSNIRDTVTFPRWHGKCIC